MARFGLRSKRAFNLAMRKTAHKTPKKTRTLREPPKVRKTYVLAFYGANGQYRQAYFQNRDEALRAEGKMKAAGKPTHLTFWIDGAEMIRLARLGYDYDPKTDKAVKSRSAKGFVQDVDAMPKAKRDSMFFDYRKFRTSDDVVKYHQSMRKKGKR